jgi:WD40 repeat protein
VKLQLGNRHRPVFTAFRYSTATTFILLIVASIAGQATGQQNSSPRVERQSHGVDAFGDPLPDGALARLGTVRFRQGNSIHTLAISPDGKIIASAGSPSTIQLWDALTGKRIRCLESSEPWIYSLAFLPDGKTLLSSGEGQAILFWDVATGKQIRRIPKAGSRLAIAPDGKRMASADSLSVSVRIWDVASG